MYDCDYGRTISRDPFLPPPRQQVHAQRGRGAPGPQVREHTADRQLQRARRRFRVRAVREPRPASGRGHVVRHVDVLVAGTVAGRAAVQPGGHGRVGHRRRAVHDGQQRAAVPGRPQGGDAQETGIGADRAVEKTVLLARTRVRGHRAPAKGRDQNGAIGPRKYFMIFKVFEFSF